MKKFFVKRIMTFSFFILFFINLSNAELKVKIKKGTTPKWLKSSISSSSFYIGIGKGESIESSYNNALSIISSQIKAKVFSKIETSKDISVTDGKRKIMEELKSNIILNTNVSLKGVELVEIWFDKKNNQYYTYCRLDIDKYEKELQKEKNNAKLKSFDLFKKAEKEQNLSLALKYYFLSFLTIAPYSDTIFSVNYNGNEINLYNEILSKILDLLGKIEINVDKNNFQIERFLKTPVDFKVYLTINKQPLSNVPINFVSQEKVLLLKEAAITDVNGIAIGNIIKVLEFKPTTTFLVTVDLKSFVKEEIKDEEILKIVNLLNSLNVPVKEIGINIKNPMFLFTPLEIEGDINKKEYEAILNKIPVLIKNKLVEKCQANFSTIEGDFTFFTKVNGNFSLSELSGFYFVKVSIFFSIVDNKTGKVIYSDATKEIKEGGNSFIKAIQYAIERFEREYLNIYIEKVISILN